MSLVPGRRWRWCVLALVYLAVTIGWPAQATAQSLTLKWDPSPDPAVVGYIVYAGTQSGQYTASFNVGRETSFTYGVVPDRQYFFAVASYAAGMTVGPRSDEVAGAAQTLALLSDPGDHRGTVGIPTDLQLLAVNSAGGTVTFSAANLPPGLLLNSSTGLVSGTPTTAGNYAVMATASDGVSTATQTFTWTIVAAPIDRTPPVVTITLPAIADRVLAEDHFVAVGGVAADDHTIVSVTWRNSRGGSGSATGTEAWLAGVVLYAGRNDITITAIDQSGNRGVATVSIQRQALGRRRLRVQPGAQGSARVN